MSTVIYIECDSPKCKNSAISESMNDGVDAKEILKDKKGPRPPYAWYTTYTDCFGSGPSKWVTTCCIRCIEPALLHAFQIDPN
jgi:hypothetical protein